MINEKPLAKPENRVPEAIKDLKMAEGHLDVLELTQLPTYQLSCLSLTGVDSHEALNVKF